jgi:hypothetical protein
MILWHRAYFRDRADPKLRHTWPTMATLATYADARCEAHPSQSRMAETLGYNRTDTIREHLRDNIRAGWLRVVHEGGPGKGTNRYLFVIPSPAETGDIPPVNGGPIPRQNGAEVLQEKDYTKGTAPEGGPPGTDDRGSSGASSLELEGVSISFRDHEDPEGDREERHPIPPVNGGGPDPFEPPTRAYRDDEVTYVPDFGPSGDILRWAVQTLDDGEVLGYLPAENDERLNHA